MADTVSKLKLVAHVSVTHDGPVTNISMHTCKREINRTLHAMCDEHIDGYDREVRVIIQNFEYSDNLENRRRALMRLLQDADEETLESLEETLEQ